MIKNRDTAVQSDLFPRYDPLLMEGRHAIFAEKWIVGYVHVRSIRSTDRWVKARIHPIPTRGLYGRNEIEIGCIYESLTLGKEIWAGFGYCGWSLYFAPLIIDEVLRTAASFPDEWIYNPTDPAFDDRHAALKKLLSEYAAREAPHPDLRLLCN